MPSIVTRPVRLTVAAFLTLPTFALAQGARTSSRVEVYEVTIPELQRAMAEGRTTSAALVDAYLARIRAYDQRGPELNTMIRLNPRARAEARAMDEERKAGKVRGPMHGIPVILKDNFDTSDLPTSGGALALANHQTKDDAFVVRRLREAGAVIIGKSNMHELAAGITTISSLGGQTRNPYDPRRCPGGSSGGTGAAIAASFAAVGWGSDTCGSIRIPSVIDLAIALDVSVGVDPADSVTKILETRPVPRFTDSLSAYTLRGTRIGILANYFTDADGEILDTVRAAVRAMVNAGADTVTVNVAGFDSLLAGTSVINFEHKYDLIDYLARTPGEKIKSIADILSAGLEVEALEARYRLADSLGTRDNEAYRRALARQKAVRARILAVMDSMRVDLLVYPTMRRRPVLFGEPQSGGTCNLSAQTGLPALSMPAGFTSDGLPVGIELLGRPFADVRLVSLAYAFEKLGARRRPPFTTPALVNGAAPASKIINVVARAAGAAARGQFVYDGSRGVLRYDVQMTGPATPRVQAIVLRRADAGGRTRVVQRLAGPGAASAGGSVVLSASDREALSQGRLTLQFLLTDRTSAEARLQGP
jgi:amidase